jgi:hypothetical protein
MSIPEGAHSVTRDVSGRSRGGRSRARIALLGLLVTALAGVSGFVLRGPRTPPASPGAELAPHVAAPAPSAAPAPPAAPAPVDTTPVTTPDALPEVPPEPVPVASSAPAPAPRAPVRQPRPKKPKGEELNVRNPYR